MIKIGEMSRRTGISISTLRRWDNDNVLKAVRSPKGYRLYTEEQVISLEGGTSAVQSHSTRPTRPKGQPLTDKEMTQ